MDISSHGDAEETEEARRIIEMEKACKGTSERGSEGASE